MARLHTYIINFIGETAKISASAIMVGNTIIPSFSMSPCAPNDAANPPIHPIKSMAIEMIPKRLNSAFCQNFEVEIRFDLVLLKLLFFCFVLIDVSMIFGFYGLKIK